MPPSDPASPTAPRPASSDQFRLLVEGVREYAIYMLDPEGRITTWNPGAERIKGYRADEILGRHFSVFYPPEDVAAGKPEAELQLAAETGAYEEEAAVRVRKDGSRFWANVLLTAVRAPDGTLTGFAKVTRDITERRRAEDARRKLEIVQEAVRARDEFLSLASHELRTPLTALRLESDALMRWAGHVAPGTQRARIERMERQIHRLGRLVEHLLDVAALASGRLRLEARAFDLGDLVREQAEVWRPDAERTGTRLHLEVDAPIPGIWDRRRLATAVSALLENAVKYGAGAPVEIAAHGDGEWVDVVVTDHGMGISPEDQARVFERFERAVPLSNYGGFGVGLWAARQIASAHGGDIVVHSAPGQGARFTIRLPRSVASARRPHAGAERAGDSA